MTSIIELRCRVENDGKSGIDLEEVHELLDCLEAAESECLEQARLNGMGSEREAALMAKLQAAEKERDWHAERCEDAMNECDALRAKLEAAESDAAHQKALADTALRVANGWGRKCDELRIESDTLRARVEQTERQEPVAWLHETRCDSDVVTDAVKHVWGKVAVGSMAAYSIPLYALPVAQPAPSVPEGWLRAIDEALVVAHIGIANPGDTYEQAKDKLGSLIGFHVDVATDPKVNGGWQLVPVNPTETFYQCFSAYDGTSYSNPFGLDDFVKDWREALAQARSAPPEQDEFVRKA